jgi:hypothetical protein
MSVHSMSEVEDGASTIAAVASGTTNNRRNGTDRGSSSSISSINGGSSDVSNMQQNRESYYKRLTEERNARKELQVIHSYTTLYSTLLHCTALHCIAHFFSSSPLPPHLPPTLSLSLPLYHVDGIGVAG